MQFTAVIITFTYKYLDLILVMESIPYNYIVIFELDDNGYVIEIKDNLEAAKLVVDSIHNSSYLTPLKKDLSLLNPNILASYTIKGNQNDNLKSEYGYFGGSFTIAVIKVVSAKNAIETFINERSNFSWVFDLDEYEDEFDRLSQIFPNMDLGAN